MTVTASPAVSVHVGVVSLLGPAGVVRVSSTAVSSRYGSVSVSVFPSASVTTVVTVYVVPVVEPTGRLAVTPLAVQVTVAPTPVMLHVEPTTVDPVKVQAGEVLRPAVGPVAPTEKASSV